MGGGAGDARTQILAHACRPTCHTRPGKGPARRWGKKVIVWGLGDKVVGWGRETTSPSSPCREQLPSAPQSCFHARGPGVDQYDVLTVGAIRCAYAFYAHAHARAHTNTHMLLPVFTHVKWGNYDTLDVQKWFEAPYDVVIAVEVAYAVGDACLYHLTSFVG